MPSPPGPTAAPAAPAPSPPPPPCWPPASCARAHGRHPLPQRRVFPRPLLPVFGLLDHVVAHHHRRRLSAQHHVRRLPQRVAHPSSSAPAHNPSSIRCSPASASAAGSAPHRAVLPQRLPQPLPVVPRARQPQQHPPEIEPPAVPPPRHRQRRRRRRVHRRVEHLLAPRSPPPRTPAITSATVSAATASPSRPSAHAPAARSTPGPAPHRPRRHLRRPRVAPPRQQLDAHAPRRVAALRQPPLDRRPRPARRVPQHRVSHRDVPVVAELRPAQRREPVARRRRDRRRHEALAPGRSPLGAAATSPRESCAKSVSASTWASMRASSDRVCRALPSSNRHDRRSRR